MAAQAPAQEERALTTSYADPEVAAAMQLYDRLQPLKDALGVADLTVPELQLFAMVAHRTGLDPFAKQIYAIKRGGRVTHQTGIDGHRSSAERTGQYLGSTEPEYELCDCGDKESPNEHPKLARVVIRRAHPSGHVVEQTGIARWHELKPDHFKPERARDYLDSMWWRQPLRQLAKCAEADGLRKAFPRVLGAVYIAEEMEQAGQAENGALVEAAAKPTARDRLRARRAAFEGQVIDGATAASSASAPGSDPAAATTTEDDSEATTGDPAAQGPSEAVEASFVAVDAAAKPEIGPMTLAELSAWLRENRIDGGYAGQVAKQLWPDTKTAADLTDEQRGALARELAGPDGGAS